MKYFISIGAALSIYCFSRFTEAVEKYYVTFFFKPYTYAARWVFSKTDFSVGLFLWYLVIPVALYIGFKFLLGKHTIKTKFKQTLLTGSWLYIIYMLLWGLLYKRKPYADIVGLKTTEPPTHTEIVAMTKDLIKEINAYSIKYKGDLKPTETSQICIETYKKMGVKVPFAHTKAGYGSTLLAYMNTAGIYNFMTAEANYNTHSLPFELPFTAAHELAHQAGIAHEDEANFLAYKVCQNTQNADFKYAAAYGVVFRFINAVYLTDTSLANSLYKSLSPTVNQHLDLERKHYEKFKNPLDTYIFRPFYDLFLKSNGIQEGSLSYGKVVDLIVAEKRKRKPKTAIENM